MSPASIASVEGLALAVQALQRAGNRIEAMRLLQAVVAADPSNRQAQAALARERRRLGYQA